MIVENNEILYCFVYSNLNGNNKGKRKLTNAFDAQFENTNRLYLRMKWKKGFVTKCEKIRKAKNTCSSMLTDSH